MPDIERIVPRSAELGGGLVVQRALPTRQRRMVGAWCFLDHAGPVTFRDGAGMHVGAHPHTALQTFTWLIEGEVLHRDSLGHEQVIRPGQVNLMTAGHGIVHTEDSPPHVSRLHAAQLWIALPPDEADRAPAFDHYPELPRWNEGGCDYTLLAGTYAGRTSPARLYSPLLGVDLHSPAGATADLALNPQFEHGLLVLDGELTIDGARFATDAFAYLGVGTGHLRLALAPGCRLLLVGGTPFGEPVVMWWNFVGHSQAAIAAAQREWESGGSRFGRVTSDDGNDRQRLVAPPLPWSDA